MLPNTNNDNDELGIFTKQPLKSNDIVINVPNKILLSVISPDEDDSTSSPNISNILSKSAIGKQVYKDVPWYVKLSIILNVLDKNLLDDISENFQPWLSTLPREFNTPFHWDDNSIKELQYPFLQQSIISQRKVWKDEYYKPYEKQFWNVYDISYNDFIWGCECARSRAFSSSYTGYAFNIKPFIYVLVFMTIYVGLSLGTLEQAANGAAVVICGFVFKDFIIPKLTSKNNKTKKRYTICPIIDMCNHVGVNEIGNVAFEYFKDSYSLTIQKEIAQSKELYISYGPRSNDQLLQYYGFVESNNIHDIYIMPPLREWDITMLESSCGRTFSLKRIEYLNSLGLLGPSTSTTTQDNDDDDNNSNILKGGVVITIINGIDPAIKQVLRILISTDDEWESSGNDISKFSETYSIDNEKCLNQVIYKAIEYELYDDKKTSFEDDEGILKRLEKDSSASSLDDSDDIELKLAFMFRLEKKEIIERNS